jgi:L-amino acid N-acyltransferase
MKSDDVIRPALASDLRAILEIYNDVIATTTAVYSEAQVTLEDRAAWFADKATRGFPVLVAERIGEVIGFATYGDFRAWPCYRHSVEHSIHVRADVRGQGLGKALLQAVVRSAAADGHHVLIAGIDANNTASIALHAGMGFTEAGVLREVGKKFGRWLDLAFMQRFLSDHTGA